MQNKAIIAPAMINPKDYQEINTLVDMLSSQLTPAWSEGDVALSNLARNVQSGRWGFDPKVDPIPKEQINRLGNVIMGPIFSSSDYPWPLENGAPMAPLLQIDLEETGHLGEVDLGQGLLQVWLPKNAHPIDKAHFRVIPTPAISSDCLEHIPKFVSGDGYLQAVDWALEESDRSVNEDGLCYQIIGWNKRFTTQLNQGVFGDFEKSIPKELIDDELKAVVKKFKSILKKNDKKWDPAGNHLFGTFYPVQYRWDERPLPIFCFDGDSEYGMAWGDGSAQVFFERSADGPIIFSFEWACY